MGQGKEAAKQYLLENPQIADEIDRIIRDTLAVGTEEIDVIGEEVTEEVSIDRVEVTSSSVGIIAAPFPIISSENVTSLT